MFPCASTVLCVIAALRTASAATLQQQHRRKERRARGGNGGGRKKLPKKDRIKKKLFSRPGQRKKGRTRLTLLIFASGRLCSTDAGGILTSDTSNLVHQDIDFSSSRVCSFFSCLRVRFLIHIFMLVGT